MAERTVGGSYWCARQDWADVVDEEGIDLSGDVVMQLPLDVEEGDMIDLDVAEEQSRPGSSWCRVAYRW